MTGTLRLLADDPEWLARFAAEARIRVADAVRWDKGAYSSAKGPFVEQVLAELRADGRLAVVVPGS